MTNTKQKTIWALGGLLLLFVLIYVVSFSMSYFASRFCDKVMLATIESPDSSKKVAVFAYNCGPTVGWSTHASILDNNDSADAESGNVLRIDSNQGRAWPRDPEGWPLIKATWQEPNRVQLLYSSGADVYFKKSSIDGVTVELGILTEI